MKCRASSLISSSQLLFCLPLYCFNMIGQVLRVGTPDPLNTRTPDPLNYHNFVLEMGQFVRIPGKHKMASNVDHRQAASL